MIVGPTFLVLHFSDFICNLYRVVHIIPFSWGGCCIETKFVIPCLCSLLLRNRPLVPHTSPSVTARFPQVKLTGLWFYFSYWTHRKMLTLVSCISLHLPVPLVSSTLYTLFSTSRLVLHILVSKLVSSIICSARQQVFWLAVI